MFDIERKHVEDIIFKDEENDERIIPLLRFVAGYIKCALWSSNDESTLEGGEPLDKNYSIQDITSESFDEMFKDCCKFYQKEHPILSKDPSQGGHDFWLTRNHHGAGFWDGDWPRNDGEILTKNAHAFGEVYLYVGDDGKIHQS